MRLLLWQHIDSLHICAACPACTCAPADVRLALCLLQVDAELQELTAKAAAALVPPSAPGPGRDMTFEEKRRLSHALGQLPGERLSRVLEIIAEGESAPQLVRGGAERHCRCAG